MYCSRDQAAIFVFACFISLLFAVPQGQALVATQVFSDAGATPADIQDTVDAFRNSLGALNPNEPINFGDGRREINWDAVPAAVSTPNGFPGDFFNFNASPRARGIEFTTPGTGFRLSGDVDDATPIEFEELDPAFSTEFSTFSTERLFSPLGSTVTEVRFFLPSDQTTPAVTDGFGAVFTDVDDPEPGIVVEATGRSTRGVNGIDTSTTIQFYDMNDMLLREDVVPHATIPRGGLSFLGVHFDDNVLARVVITAGTDPIDSGLMDGSIVNQGGRVDIVAMDDFIFGEPIPEPTSGLLLLIAAVVLASRRNP